MQKDMDTIQFEYRQEIIEVMQDLAKVQKPNDSTKRLLELLDIMDMEW